MYSRTYRMLASIFLLSIAYIATSDVYADSAKNTIQDLIQTLKKQLPQGWDISFDEKQSWIEIQRVKPELMFNVAANLSGDEKPTLQNFTLAMEIVPFVCKDEYKKFQSENETTQKKMDALYNSLTHSRPVWGWPGAFHPVNEEQKQEFKEYNRLASSLHALPNFYFGNLSLSCAPENQEPVDDTVRKDCQQVRKEISRTLTAY